MNSAVITMTAEKWDEVNLDWSLVDSEQYSQTFRLGLAEQMKELLDEDGSSEIIYIGAGVFCCFLDLSSMVRSSVMHQRLTDAASVCFRWCEHQTYVYSISVSNICIGEDGIRQAYQQTREMGKMDFYVKGSILYYDGTNMVSENLSPAAEELIDKIGMIINGRKNKLLEEYWEKILAYTKEMHTDSRVLIHWLKRLDRAAGIERTADFYKTIRDFGQFALIGSNYEEDVFSKKKIEVPEGTSKTVKLAIEFVYHNYKKQIGLQDAAEAAGVNAAYLSFLFKQEMKIGFSNYLQECRIDCARQLLVESNLKIKDVAAESGFNDYHYFSKTFKKLNGCSPAEYRRNGS
ncbi:MAG: AraC family transcriptional regulator [Clostridia bacterium]|nr:AraC family transcriptional regulator [Clostridia bacterium]